MNPRPICSTPCDSLLSSVYQISVRITLDENWSVCFLSRFISSQVKGETTIGGDNSVDSSNRDQEKASGQQYTSGGLRPIEAPMHAMNLETTNVQNALGEDSNTV